MALRKESKGLKTTAPRRSGSRWMEDRLRPFFMILLVLVTLLSAAFANVWLSQQCRLLTYEISKLEKSIRMERETSLRLEVETASLKSLSRIERIAMNELQLSTPTPEQIIELP
ncbi:MAG: cell division protein FtsL [Deltaproteobacteria bacterium]|nr:cell division protein FtsL [Deltaproteobacteria bacterium]